VKVSGINPAFCFNSASKRFGRFQSVSKLNKTPPVSYTKSDTADMGSVKGGMYVTPLQTTKAQQNTISMALSELSKVEFSPDDLSYMRSLGVNLPFTNGKDAVDFLQKNNIDIKYGIFSNPSVHACLDTSKNPPTVLVNSAYKDLATQSDVFAISEALMHEAGHARDFDSLNSVQEEIDCLALNVLTHKYYEKHHPGVFSDKNSFLYREGVSLYADLFYDVNPSKTALKKRVSDKYGFLDTTSPNHPASKMACDIKALPA